MFPTFSATCTRTRWPCWLVFERTATTMAWRSTGRVCHNVRTCLRHPVARVVPNVACQQPCGAATRHARRHARRVHMSRPRLSALPFHLVEPSGGGIERATPVLFVGDAPGSWRVLWAQMQQHLVAEGFTTWCVRRCPPSYPGAAPHNAGVAWHILIAVVCFCVCQCCGLAWARLGP